MPDAWRTRSARVLVESTRVSQRRLAETVRHSLHDGLQAYSALSPECRRTAGLISLRRLAGSLPLKLDTSVGVPGPHGFAVRDCALVSRSIRIHRIPRPRP